MNASFRTAFWAMCRGLTVPMVLFVGVEMTSGGGLRKAGMAAHLGRGSLRDHWKKTGDKVADRKPRSNPGRNADQSRKRTVTKSPSAGSSEPRVVLGPKGDGRRHRVSEALQVALGPHELPSSLGGVSPPRREPPELDAGEGHGPAISGSLLGPQSRVEQRLGAVKVLPVDQERRQSLLSLGFPRRRTSAAIQISRPGGRGARLPTGR